MVTNPFDEMFAAAQDSEEYLCELAILDFTRDIYRQMKNQNLNKVELARRLGTSPSYITKILGGNANFTLKSMTRIAKALGCKLHIHMAEDDRQVKWFEVVTSPPDQRSEFHSVSIRPFQVRTKEAAADAPTLAA